MGHFIPVDWEPWLTAKTVDVGTVANAKTADGELWRIRLSVVMGFVVGYNTPVGG